MTEKKKNCIKRNLQAYGFLTPFLVLVSHFIYFTGNFNCCNGFYRFRRCIYLGVCRAEEF